MGLENKADKPVLRSLVIPVVSERGEPFTLSEACAPTPNAVKDFFRLKIRYLRGLCS